MKNVRKHILYAIALVIAGLVMTSAASVSITITSPEEKETNAEFAVANCQPISAKTLDISMESLPLGGVQVTGGDEDEYHPSVAAAPGGGFYAMTEFSEDGVIWHPRLMYSDDGTTWEGLVSFSYDNAEYTDMDQNEHGTYGTFGAAPDSGGEVIVVQGEIEDGWVWNFGDDGFDENSNNRISCYTFEGPEGDPGLWNWGCLTLTGYNNYNSADDEGCPYIFYQVSEPGQGVIGWLNFEEDVYCEHTGDALDLITNMHYAVYDFDIGGSDDWDLLIRKDDFGSWYWHTGMEAWAHEYLESWVIDDDTANLMYPSAAASNDNVIVACQKDDDVVVYYSTNGFEDVFEVPVEESASYPEVAMPATGLAVITYIKDDVLYYRTSNDGGESWSDAEVASDNQVNFNDRAAQLEDFGGQVHGVWEDTRGDNIDIYFDLIYSAGTPSAPDIDGETNGKPGTSYPYTFTSTDPDGDQVSYYIEWGDGDITDWTALQASGPPGYDESHTWEEGTWTIKAKAKDENGLEGPVATLSVTMPRNRAISSPFLKFLQQHPNLFPILRYILGL